MADKVGAVRVKGLRDLNKAFARADRMLDREWKTTLRQAAEPVRATAERLAHQKIRNIGDDWSQMRVGVTRNAVYVAPFKKGTRVATRKRPNLADLLIGRAMSPALEKNKENVVRNVNELLEKMGNEWGRGG